MERMFAYRKAGRKLYRQDPLSRPKKEFRRRFSLTTCKAELGLSGLIIGDEHFIIIQPL